MGVNEEELIVAAGRYGRPDEATVSVAAAGNCQAPVADCFPTTPNCQGDGLICFPIAFSAKYPHAKACCQIIITPLITLQQNSLLSSLYLHSAFIMAANLNMEIMAALCHNMTFSSPSITTTVKNNFWKVVSATGAVPPSLSFLSHNLAPGLLLPGSGCLILSPFFFFFPSLLCSNRADTNKQRSLGSPQPRRLQRRRRTWLWCVVQEQVI